MCLSIRTGGLECSELTKCIIYCVTSGTIVFAKVSHKNYTRLTIKACVIQSIKAALSSYTIFVSNSIWN